MAIRQGSIDRLCGVYSVLNATEIVIGGFKCSKSYSQKRGLFCDLIIYLEKKNKLRKAVTKGISKIDSPDGLLDIAVKSVKKHQQLKMRKRKAFSHNSASLNEYWETLTTHLLLENAAIIISLSGRRDHWTCVKRVTPEALILADSSGMKHILRSNCIIGFEKKGMYTLWPSMTYLLSIDDKTVYS